MAETIKSICGIEPQREGEYPVAYVVGQGGTTTGGTITEIRRREEHFGDHGLAWYDVYVGEARVASMAARAVAEIAYEAPKPPKAPHPNHNTSDAGCICPDCIGF